jgi:hypothetical protein
VRRWTTGASIGPATSKTTSDYVWNISPESNSFGGYRCTGIYYNYYISTVGVSPTNRNGCSTGTLAGDYTAIDTTNKFILLGSTQSTIIENNWNYIEIKFVNENNVTTGTLNQGSIKLKLNRNSSDPYLDIDANNIRTSTQSGNHLCSKIAFGVFWGHNSGATASAASLGWTTYIDDFYWLDTTGSVNNNFLGRVSCKKFNYDTVVNYNMNNPANSGTALNNINETFSGKNFTNIATTRTSANATSTSIDTRNSTISSESLTPIHVRQYAYGYRTDTGADLYLGASLSGNNTSLDPTTFSTNNAAVSLKYKDYVQAPDGTSWTNSKIANTTFRHSANASS